jgi:hypothetical protein
MNADAKPKVILKVILDNSPKFFESYRLENIRFYLRRIDYKIKKKSNKKVFR